MEDFRKLGAHWANTSSNRLAGELLQGGTLCTPIDEQVAFSQLEHEESAIWNLLLAAGYLRAEHFELDKEREGMNDTLKQSPFPFWAGYRKVVQQPYRGRRNMIIKSASLDTVCGVKSALPEHTLPEIAFAGRSNVGKSSLINSLMNRKSLARTSSQPGKTQTLNYYNVNNQIYLVDLPGYGYTKIAKSVSDQWGPMVERYLYRSRNLQAIFQLLDIRHAPSANDKTMYQWITSNGYEPILIATKLDKLKRSQVQKHLREIREVLQAPEDARLIPFSALSKQGREEIWEIMEAVIGGEYPYGNHPGQ